MKVPAGRGQKRLRTALIQSPPRAVKSALQQTPICGLRGWDFPIPPMPAKDQNAVAQAPPDAGGVILLRSALEIVCAARRQS